MHIAFASDNNYVQHLGVALYSLIKFNTKNLLNVHIMNNGISDENIAKLKKIIEGYEVNLYFYDCSDEYIANKFNQKLWADRALTTYLRIFLSDVIPNHVDKIIYMDVDAIVNDSLDKLWNIDMEDNLIAGVKDIVPSFYKLAIGLDEDDDYINAGFLLINLKLWREEDLVKDFIDFVNRKDGKVLAMDQGTINALTKGRFLLLGLEYNMMTPFLMYPYEKICKMYNLSNFYSRKEYEYAQNNSIFIHFVPGLTTRPWVDGCRHPKKDLYLKYLQKTPWNDYVLQKDNRRNLMKILDFLERYLPFSCFLSIYKLVIFLKNKKSNFYL